MCLQRVGQDPKSVDSHSTCSFHFIPSHHATFHNPYEATDFPLPSKTRSLAKKKKCCENFPLCFWAMRLFPHHLQKGDCTTVCSFVALRTHSLGEPEPQGRHWVPGRYSVIDGYQFPLPYLCFLTPFTQRHVTQCRRLAEGGKDISQPSSLTK